VRLVAGGDDRGEAASPRVNEIFLAGEGKEVLLEDPALLPSGAARRRGRPRP
jgi:hypothetical protein